MLLPNTRRGKLLAAKLGFALKRRCLTMPAPSAYRTVKDSETHGLRRSGDWRRTHCHAYAVLTISSGTFDAAPPDASPLAKRTPWSGRLRLWRLPARSPGAPEQQRRSRQSPSGGQRGRGIGSKENIALAEQLCKAKVRSWPVLVRWQKTKNGWSTTLCRYLQPDAET